MMHPRVFNDLYEQFYERSFFFAKSFVHIDEVSEEIASDALISLWEKMKQEKIYSPKNYLYQIVKNKSWDYLKYQANYLNLFEPIDNWDPEDVPVCMSFYRGTDPEEMLSTELSKVIKDIVNSFPEKTRKVFIMSRFKHLSGKEIAKRMGISVKGVEYHITKALKTLSAELKDYS